ncbi:hypothetical protein J3454_03245 [Erythrobacter sp. NFXS35]|uniref:hypothetical protein n=1 Tax=Erythrobacter sp. NFXS35 TaxID=2818436 RepID=UPI0032E040CE
MSQEIDFIFIDLPAIARTVVTIDDEQGSRPDPDWHHEVLEGQYVFLEFLAEQNLLSDEVEFTRSPDLVVRWLQLNEEGRRFARSEYDKWLRTIGKSGMPQAIKREKLVKRWQKYCVKENR